MEREEASFCLIGGQWVCGRRKEWMGRRCAPLQSGMDALCIPFLATLCCNSWLQYHVVNPSIFSPTPLYLISAAARLPSLRRWSSSCCTPTGAAPTCTCGGYALRRAPRTADGGTLRPHRCVQAGRAAGTCAQLQAGPSYRRGAPSRRVFRILPRDAVGLPTALQPGAARTRRHGRRCQDPAARPTLCAVNHTASACTLALRLLRARMRAWYCWNGRGVIGSLLPARACLPRFRRGRGPGKLARGRTECPSVQRQAAAHRPTV